MKKFNAGLEKSDKNSVWWGLVNGLTDTVSLSMIEEKFSVTRKDDEESIFDLVLRTGLASTFQETVALLVNTFPPPEPPPQVWWKRILAAIPTARDRKY